MNMTGQVRAAGRLTGFEPRPLTQGGHADAAPACQVRTSPARAEAEAGSCRRAWESPGLCVLLTEITIGWGEDDHCAGCGYFLAAGTPAWLDEDGRALCCDCAAGSAA